MQNVGKVKKLIKLTTLKKSKIVVILQNIRIKIGDFFYFLKMLKISKITMTFLSMLASYYCRSLLIHNLLVIVPFQKLFLYID